MAAVVVGVLGAMGIVAAVAFVVVWGGRSFASGAPTDDRPVGDDVRWWLRLVAVHLTAGIVSGVLVAGMGGRLAMRVIAATSGRAAQGRLTEAEQVVGSITASGTIGFLVFIGIGAGIAGGLLHVVLRPVLPSGRLGGLLFGAFLLVVASTRVEPLRADNRDFDIVGPDLVSLAIFGALPVLFGMTVAALAARLSTAIPLLSRSPATWVAHIAHVFPLLLVPLFAVVVVGGALAVGARRAVATPPSLARSAADRARVASRVVAATVVLVAFPGFAAAVADIAGG